MERTNDTGPGAGQAPGQGPLDQPNTKPGSLVGGDPFLGGGMIPPSAGVDDHLPMDDSPGEPTPEEQERGEDTPA